MNTTRSYIDTLSLCTYGVTRTEAHIRNICLRCKQPASWSIPAGKAEYQQSAICEPCFDKIFADL